VRQVFEGEARRQHAVEKGLQQARHGAPPGRVDEHQVVGPGDQLPGMAQVLLDRLDGRVERAHVAIEAQVGEPQLAQLDAGARRALAIGARERAAQARLARMADDDQHLERAGQRRRGNPGTGLGASRVGRDDPHFVPAGLLSGEPPARAGDSPGGS
jgi:hypothetical protein